MMTDIHKNTDNLQLWKKQFKRIFKKFKKRYHQSLKFKDIEDLHQTRVHLRKLLTLLKFLIQEDTKDENTVAGRFYTTLQNIEKALGEIRDLDVLLEDLQHLKEQVPVDKALLKVIRKLRKMKRLQIGLQLPNDYNEPLMLLWEDFMCLHLPGYICKLDAHATLLKLMAKFDSRLQKYETMKEQHGEQSPETLEALHAVRIQAKKLRYTCTYVEFALDKNYAEAARQYKKIQNWLGEINNLKVYRSEISMLLNYYTYLDSEKSQALLQHLDHQILVKQEEETLSGFTHKIQ
ncbi:CHAD domain-containing protein [Rapidithrix thailandica]|uniref:CHAD domain-containing protein n=1 Tax=Rapidithrix thailandica TaxID=413964 RepID=A0AAW9S4D5_9BACT